MGAFAASSKESRNDEDDVTSIHYGVASEDLGEGRDEKRACCFSKFPDSDQKGAG